MAHGFDEVTITQVADAAGVAKMTVTNYFPRKEDLVFDRAETVIGHLAQVVAAETGTDSPQQRLAAALLASVHRVLYTEARQRSLAGQPRPEICAALAEAGSQASDLLEPALGASYPRA